LLVTREFVMKTAAMLGVMLAALAVPAQADPVAQGEHAFRRGDSQRAARKFRPPAKHGHPLAQTYMGFLYQTGRGVPQFRPGAAKYYQWAAEQGNPIAQYNLGLLYDKGHGVPQNYVLAHKWVNLAASRSRGDEREYYARIRDAIESKMSHDQLETAQYLARDWEKSHRTR
jgi:TPR repeat protein